MNKLVTGLITTLSLACLPATVISAELALHGLFGDHMVLQRDRDIPVWGQAAPGEKITVVFAGQSVHTETDPLGAWRVTLPALAANTEGRDLVVRGSSEIVVRDVLVGDVWLCTGQSNMEWDLHRVEDPAAVDADRYPILRHFKVARNNSPWPVADVRGNWRVCSEETVGNFTAVGYFFARSILESTENIPIGLLNSSWGGTQIEPWTSLQGFQAVPELSERTQRIEQWHVEGPAGRDLMDTHLQAMQDWLDHARTAHAHNRPPRAMPELPGPTSHQSATKLFNGMIHPLAPYAIQGAIWYQGESNGREGLEYVDKKRALLHSWRSIWGQGDFPFYYVQLANFRESDPNDPAGGDGWARIRDAQRVALTLPQTGMAVAIDVGEANDIHPRNKKDVGYRLARWALADIYGLDIVKSGPLYKDHSISDHRIHISFDHVGSGLMIGHKESQDPTREVKDGTLQWFAIAGADRVWHWADAVIEGDKVIVSSKAVPEPVAVRYAFTMNPEGANLYNREGLPASPFRTDTW